MTTIAVTGPRQLTAEQRVKALQKLTQLSLCSHWLVGDATGLDALAQSVARSHGLDLKVYEKRLAIPYRAQGAERSTRMIKDLVTRGGTLHAWPNQPAPGTLKPSRSWPTGAGGSGTWGTIALAVGLGISVEVHPLAEFDLPHWLNHEQLMLL